MLWDRTVYEYGKHGSGQWLPVHQLLLELLGGQLLTDLLVLRHDYDIQMQTSSAVIHMTGKQLVVGTVVNSWHRISNVELELNVETPFWLWVMGDGSFNELTIALATNETFRAFCVLDIIGPWS